MREQVLNGLYQIKGRVEGRAFCLETNLTFTQRLVKKLETPEYRSAAEGRLDTLVNWYEYNKRLLADICQLIKEAESEWR